MQALMTVLRQALLVLAICSTASAQPSEFDIVIKSGRIADGTGNPGFFADVAIKGDTIAAIAPQIVSGKARVIDARGLVVAPGFIDVHSHSEVNPGGLLANPAAENNVRQGVTTVFANPDGMGDVPILPFLQRVTASRPAINLGAFVGHGSIRAKVMGHENRAATNTELDQMRELVRLGMQDGAFGLSTGLFYVPANYAPTTEIIELATVAGVYGGIHQSHMRDEAGDVLDSVRETILIGQKGRLPTQITHHKVVGKANWGRSIETLRLVDEARANGIDVTIDQYPYTASLVRIVPVDHDKAPQGAGILHPSAGVLGNENDNCSCVTATMHPGLTMCVMNSAMMKTPPIPTAKLIQLLTKPCPVCGASGWVCQFHILRPMGHDGCGQPGKACRCNPEAVSVSDEDWTMGPRNPPRRRS